MPGCSAARFSARFTTEPLFRAFRRGRAICMYLNISVYLYDMCMHMHNTQYALHLAGQSHPLLPVLPRHLDHAVRQREHDTAQKTTPNGLCGSKNQTKMSNRHTGTHRPRVRPSPVIQANGKGATTHSTAHLYFLNSFSFFVCLLLLRTTSLVK